MSEAAELPKLKAEERTEVCQRLCGSNDTDETTVPAFDSPDMADSMSA